LTVGKVAVLAWPGQPANPSTTYQGVKWIHAESWVPYQRTNFVTPAFPGYVSGHSTFSRSAAEVLTAITGSPFFPGGMGTYNAPADTGLGFEKGPSQAIQLQWATYYDAADQAGLSRIWGGIHPPVDDFGGRRVGSECGKAVWALAQKHFDGSLLDIPIALSIRPIDPTTTELHFETTRGIYYKLQSTTDLSLPFVDDPMGSTLAHDSFMLRTDSISGPQKFYRVIGSLNP